MYTYNECSNDDTYNIQIIYSLLHSPASFFTDNQSEKHYIFHCYYLIFNKQDEFVKWWQSHGGVYQWPWLWVTMLMETLTFIFFLTLSFSFFFCHSEFLKMHVFQSFSTLSIQVLSCSLQFKIRVFIFSCVFKYDS